MTYTPPLRDLAFALNDVAGIGTLRQSEAFAAYDEETQAAVLDAAGKLARDVLAPLNWAGDQAGARFANSAVTAPPGFADAYRQFADGGWNALSAAPDYGGMALPKALEIAAFEMFDAANMAFGLCPMLTQGAIEALSAHGTDARNGATCRNSSPAMDRHDEFDGAAGGLRPCLAEDPRRTRRTTAAPPHGPEDLHHLGRPRLRRQHRPSGARRLPDAPAGTKGVSLFVAPNGARRGREAGEPTRWQPGGIEHKLGIHGSPTCTMRSTARDAELVGAKIAAWRRCSP